VVDVLASMEGRDLGSVARDIDRVIAGVKLPKSTRINVRGQIESMRTSFGPLALGLVLASLLVYLLLFVLFQSWVDPFIIIFAVPGALVGIAWALALTGSTLNVESFMGAVMAVGLAVANSILPSPSRTTSGSRTRRSTPARPPSGPAGQRGRSRRCPGSSPRGCAHRARSPAVQGSEALAQSLAQLRNLRWPEDEQRVDEEDQELAHSESHDGGSWPRRRVRASRFPRSPGASRTGHRQPAALDGGTADPGRDAWPVEGAGTGAGVAPWPRACP
jgi:hypothetical protein